ncbi:MAG: hypothetical protein AAFY13_12845 [Pseudomonadota bacterium]
MVPHRKAERFILDGSLLLANGGAADSDINLDVLTIVAVNGQAILASGMIILPSFAVVTVNVDGTFSYDATNAFDFLEDGAKIRPRKIAAPANAK